MRSRQTSGLSLARVISPRRNPARWRRASGSATGAPRPARRRSPAWAFPLLCAALGGVALLTPVSARADSSTAYGYLRSYLDAKEKLGAATTQTEGVVEVRGSIQGKMSSQQTTTWIVRDEAGGDAAAYQFVSATDLPAFAVGLRVRALGRGLATAGSSLQLVAMVFESEMAEWEQAHPAQQPAPRPEPTRIITYPQPSSSATLSPTPARGEASPGEAAAPIRSASAPAAPPPPRWRDPSRARTRPAQAQSAARQRAATARRQASAPVSRSWAGYLAAYTRAIRWFNPRLTTAQADAISRSILAFSVRYGIDARLVVAVIAVESGFSPTATSNKGAMGLGQLMPGTAAGLGVRNAYDPVENVYGAVKLLRGHLKEHKGKPFWEQLALALASYNAGSGAVKRYGGVPPYRETQRYVVKVAQLYAHLCGYRKK